MTPPPATVVRPPVTSDEIAAFFRLAAAQFMRASPVAIAQEDVCRYVYDSPAAIPSGVRGAFRGDDYLGGYLSEERDLRIGPARLRAGCIGMVVVDPARRGQGIGTALMRDALVYARARGHVLLILNGLADYYRPFGYADVFDATEHAVERAAILASPPSPYHVREATADDAPALLALYDRHYGPHPGSFARSVEQQAFLVRFAAARDREAYSRRDGSPFEPPLVALDADGRPRGYLTAAWGPLRAFGSEVAADDWPATLALLQHDARQAGRASEPAERVRWPLPPDSLAAAFLADHFPVERVSTSRPWANWEALLVDPHRLMRELVPTWSERWLRSAERWSGSLALTIDGATTQLDLGPAGVALVAAPRHEARAVTLTGRAAMPLVFGFRSVAWATLQEGQEIPLDAVPILEILFPPVTPWIAPTDGC
ncbi:MAG: GNAT family N-acetyltransferase [Thermomicrobiales bacterium]|nr:GNAT family N-acetyltransferase [Thermomicrobiales bacterium]